MKDNHDQYFAHIWALFCTIEALDLIGHDLSNSFKQVRQEKKQHLNKLLKFIKKWKATSDVSSRMNYSQKAQDMISDMSALMMETLIVTCAVPREQMDYFAEGVKSLQLAASNRERTRVAKLQKEVKDGKD